MKGLSCKAPYPTSELLPSISLIERSRNIAEDGCRDLILYRVLVVLLITSIAHQLHPPNHLPNGKETKHFCAHDSYCSHIFAAHVPYLAEDAFWRCRAGCLC